MALTKKCPRCGKELPATSEYFYMNASRKDGLGVYCKDCVREINEDFNAKKKGVPASAPAAITPIPITNDANTASVLKACGTKELIAELISRGKKVLVDPTPRDCMELLVAQGYKGQLTYTKVETIDITKI